MSRLLRHHWSACFLFEAKEHHRAAALTPGLSGTRKITVHCIGKGKHRQKQCDEDFTASPQACLPTNNRSLLLDLAAAQRPPARDKSPPTIANRYVKRCYR